MCSESEQLITLHCFQSLIFSSLRLEMYLPDGYPTQPAKVRFLSCVGLSNKDAEKLEADVDERCRMCAKDSCGSLFEIINLLKEYVNR